MNGFFKFMCISLSIEVPKIPLACEAKSTTSEGGAALVSSQLVRAPSLGKVDGTACLACQHAISLVGKNQFVP